MCGIWGYLGNRCVTELFKSYMSLVPRGPDKSDFRKIYNNMYIGFHRLSIMDKSSNGDQPFNYDKGSHSIYATCNGEIYNFKKLLENDSYIKQFLKSGSDCEFLPYMYSKYGFENMVNMLEGEFAISIVDINNETNEVKLYLARDKLAVRPLFIGYDNDLSEFVYSSILKGINCKNSRQLSRGEIMEVTFNDRISINSYMYHSLKNIDKYNYVSDNEMFDKIRTVFTEAVECRLVSDRPLGALLSGGLDSSLVVSIASRFLKKFNKTLRTFSVGIPGSTDKEYAQMVSDYLGTIHTHVEFTENDFVNAIEEVINAIETYDITTIRASIGQYLISKWIKENTDIKVLLIGDGSDELCSGYMYFHQAPDYETSHNENIRLLEEIQYYDVLRADRCIAYNGIEARVPFLDHRFVELYLSLPTDKRVPKQVSEQVKICKKLGGRKVEKWLLRMSFLDNYLPEEVLWRKKEAFSDGVSSQKKSLFKIIQDNVENMFVDEDFNNDDVNYNITCSTKEALYYRTIFNKHFDKYVGKGIVPHIWLPLWCGNITDPSARVLKVYE